MRREPALLDGAPFDLLVIGGGVYGAWTAYDAALRGLRVALVEQDDWASATSSASSKLIHGGLRYLEYGWVGLVQRSLRERARLLRLAPHRVRPLPFLLPVFDDSRTPSWQLRLGLALYDRLGGSRDPLPDHRALPTDALRTQLPQLAADGLRGGFSYTDAATDDGRFVLELVAGAIAAGAVAVNHVEAVSLLRDAAGAVQGATLIDRLDGRSFELRAAVTVAAAGPWIEGLAGLPTTSLARLSKGVHLVMPPLPRRQAVLLTARTDGRVFFLLPWYGATLLGTTDADYRGDPARVGVDAADIDYLLAAANERCPGLEWSADDIRGCFAGLRTLRCDSSGAPSAATREWKLEQPSPGLLLPVGGKFTSARQEGELIVDRVLALLGRAHRRSQTGRRRFPWCPSGPWRDWLPEQVQRGRALGLPVDIARSCARRYGRTVSTLFALLAERPELARRVHADAPFCDAELVHAARDEMACTLHAVLRRRVPLAILVRLDAAALDQAARLIGDELGWDAARRARELGLAAELGNTDATAGDQ